MISRLFQLALRGMGQHSCHALNMFAVKCSLQLLFPFVYGSAWKGKTKIKWNKVFVTYACKKVSSFPTCITCNQHTPTHTCKIQIIHHPVY